MARGDLVLARFPFTDLSGHKRRPALVIASPVNNSLLVAFVTSRIAAAPRATEHILSPADPEFALAGLKTASLVRLHHLATLDRSLITRRFGRIGPRTAEAVARALRHLFELL